MFDTIGIYEGIIKLADIEILVELEQLFQKINYTDHQLEVSEIECLGESMTAEIKGASVVAVYEKHTSVLLMAMGIYLMDDDTLITFRDIADILITALSIESPDNADIVISTLEDDFTDTRDELCELLAALSDRPAIYYVMRIDIVDEALTARIRKDSGDPGLYEHALLTMAGIRKELKAYIGDDNTSPLYKLIVASPQLPINYKRSLISAEDDLLGLSVPEIAYGLYGLAIASAVPAEYRVQITQQSREEIISGLKGNMIDSELIKIHKELTNA